MKILVGYDYSTVTQDVLALAKQHAQAFKAEVHLLRSLEQNSELQRDTIQQAEQNLDHVRREFATMDLACDTHVVVSAPVGRRRYRPIRRAKQHRSNRDRRSQTF